MAPPEPLFEQLSELIRALSTDVRQQTARRRKRFRRMLRKLVRTFALLTVSTMVIIVGMIASGLFLGPRGVEGLLALPIVLLLTWSAILYLSFRRKAPPRVAATGNVGQLPARTEEWLEEQRRTLPAPGQQKLDSILLRLEVLTPQLQSLAPDSPAATEIRRLLAEELPELVRGYQKVPHALRGQPSHGEKSPDHQLLEGLDTVDEEMGRIHARLAADDLRAMATQQRYLEMKYKRGGDFE